MNEPKIREIIDGGRSRWHSSSLCVMTAFNRCHSQLIPEVLKSSSRKCFGKAISYHLFRRHVVEDDRVIGDLFSGVVVGNRCGGFAYVELDLLPVRWRQCCQH